MNMLEHIATLTFHEAYNYGAILQAYALQEAIKSFGCEVEILNYACPAIRQAYGKPHGFKKRIGWILRARDYEKRKNKFDCFREKYLQLSEPLDRKTLQRASARYDAVIVGSDQVWNPVITGNDTAFFLDFLQDSSRKKTYAASLGTETWPTHYEQELAQRASQFSSILVREKTAAAYLARLISRPVETVCDPVFLLDRKQWKKVAVYPRTDKPYVLVIPLGRPEDDCVKWVRNIADQRGWDVVVLHSSAFHVADSDNVKDAGPCEYLGYLAKAEMVVTNSFHASCFSLIFGRQFCWFKSGAAAKDLALRESRLRDLLTEFDLDDHTASASSRLPLDIDFERAMRKVSFQRERSLHILGEILER